MGFRPTPNPFGGGPGPGGDIHPPPPGLPPTIAPGNVLPTPTVLAPPSPITAPVTARPLPVPITLPPPEVGPVSVPSVDPVEKDVVGVSPTVGSQEPIPVDNPAAIGVAPIVPIGGGDGSPPSAVAVVGSVISTIFDEIPIGGGPAAIGTVGAGIITEAVVAGIANFFSSIGPGSIGPGKEVVGAWFKGFERQQNPYTLARTLGFVWWDE